MPSIQADDLLPLLKSRRSIRAYQDQPVPEETIWRLLEAACWGPSAHNRQPWRFVVLTVDTDRSQLADAMAERLASDLKADGVPKELIEKDTGRSRKRLISAPVLILVCLSMLDMDRYPDDKRSQAERTMAVQSVAMAAQNLLLQAHADGLGAVWMCAPLFCPDTVRTTLRIPDDFEPQGIIALGYPAQDRQRSRDPIHTKVIFK
ncbi:MAG: nitroreductase family protein [Chloroflexi bacterium]|nr:nitroreductase family protein [Chloroflexota bacterium]